MQSNYLLAAASLAALSIVACSGGTVTSTAQTVPFAKEVSNSFATGDVFTASNATSGNVIMRFHRAANGQLSELGTLATSGTGSGNGINGASDTIKVDLHGNFLFTVDAGSNDIVSVDVGATGMKLLDKVASGGTVPASLAIHNNLLYVLNTGSNQITGFTVDPNGKMTPVRGSTVSLSGSPSDDPVDLHFGPGGKTLITTQKLSNVIDVFTVDSSGVAHGPIAHVSEGLTPFGFSVTDTGHVLVSEAFGGAAHAGAMSSYQVQTNGGLKEISESVKDHQAAPCWVALTHDQRFAYLTNTGSGNVSGYTVAPDGKVALLNSSGIVGNDGSGSAPIDLGISADDSFAYVLDSGTHNIDEFRRDAGGTLDKIGTTSGLPASAIGIAVR